MIKKVKNGKQRRGNWTIQYGRTEDQVCHLGNLKPHNNMPF